jgi:hypothetical protein
MNNELVTTETILTWLQTSVEERQIIGPSMWLDAAAKLTVLLGDEHDKLFDLQQQVAQMKVQSMEDGDTAARAKIKAEATDVYKAMCSQRARIERIEEMVRVAKIQARMKDNEQSSY